LARQLLAEAGYPNGFEKPIEFLIYVSERQPRAVQIAEAVIRDLEAIGLTVNRRMMEYAQVAPIWRNRESAWQMKLNMYGPYPEPWTGGIWYSTYSENPAYNEGFESLTNDEWLVKCASTLDYDERQEVIMEYGDWLETQYFGTSVVITSRVFALTPKVGDVPLGMAPFEYIWRFLEYATHGD
jgi:peptide/nickel transport system substrate-binding protein